MALSEAEKQMLQDMRREIDDLRRSQTRVRKGVVTDAGGPILKIRLGGECGNQEIEAIATGPVSQGDVVTVLESGGGAIVSGTNQDGSQTGLDQGPGIVIDGLQVSVDNTVARRNGDGNVVDVASPAISSHAANKAYVDLLIALTLGNIQEVGSLPASPFNGQTVLFNGWLCRYDSTPPNPSYPWAVIGGASITAQAAGLVSVTGNSPPSDISGGLSFSLPSRGIYRIKIGGDFQFGPALFNGQTVSGVHTYRVGPGAGNERWGWRAALRSLGTDGELWSSGSKEWRHTVATPGVQVVEQGWAALTGMVGGRYLKAIPEWIGA